MNRRNFITGIIAACVAPTILPSAKIEPRRWKVPDGCRIARWGCVMEEGCSLTRATIRHFSADDFRELGNRELELELRRKLVDQGTLSFTELLYEREAQIAAEKSLFNAIYFGV